jgi:hypothetical protein
LREPTVQQKDFVHQLHLLNSPWSYFKEGLLSVKTQTDTGETRNAETPYGDPCIRVVQWHSLAPVQAQALGLKGYSEENWRYCPLSGMEVQFFLTAWTRGKRFANGFYIRRYDPEESSMMLEQVTRVVS